MELTLINKEHLIDNVWSFRLQPSGPFAWDAGQFVRIDLPHDDPDSEGTSRWFTNSAAPYEGIMQITTRVTESTFKQALSRMQPGDALTLTEAPEGDFVWEDTDLPVVFIAGGIGVTPFRSILKQRVHDGAPLDVTLVYSNRTEEITFQAEFDEWAATRPELTVKYLVGTRLSAESLAEMIPALNRSLVYLSGPEAMVESLGDELKERGLPATQLKQDYFPNYDETNF